MRVFFLFFAAIVFSSCSSLSQYVVPPPSDMAPQARQAVVVNPQGKDFHAVVTGWKRMSSGWQRVLGPWPCVVGRKGFAPEGEKREGDGQTPSGVFALKRAFGRDIKIKTALDYREAGADDFWVDDVSSKQYNLWVHGAPLASSFEKMKRDDGLYDIGAVIEYNTDPVVAGQGSAIFIHVWRGQGARPTAGCVAMEHRRVGKLLSWLDKNENPVIKIGR
ncbi:MAG: L,D-transpeptidase family protein [Candidatus Omnitrophica bacterium]|nr:L,D-transpeptidase family protein [Candidatus Omnitrophota bacterium]